MIRQRGARDGARGFALVFSVVISVVMIGLATAVLLRVLTDQRVNRNVARQLASREDAELALRLAENEIMGATDRVLATFWTNQATFSSPPPAAGHYSSETSFRFSELDINAAYPGQDDASQAKHRPLLQLTLLANPRNWPVFCDWSKFSGSWNGEDEELTRYWRLVPRDDQADVDWYSGAGVTSFPVIIAPRKDPQTGNLFPSSAYLTTVSLPGDPRNGQKAVKHSFWYNELLPVTSGAAAVPLPATPPPDPAEPYLPSGPQWANLSAEYPTTMNVLDTPFYKKLYKMPSGVRVAVYCRLDLRDYLTGSASLDVWQRSSDRMLRFFLAAVTEGRVDGKGANASFKPPEIFVKYIYLTSGGAELTALNVTAQDIIDAYGSGVPQDHNTFPGVLDNVGRTVPAGATLSGVVHRSDGNLAYKFEAAPPTVAPRLKLEKLPDGTVKDVWAPASASFFYMWEDARTDRTDTSESTMLQNSFLIWLSYDREDPADKTKWRWRRLRTKEIAGYGPTESTTATGSCNECYFKSPEASDTLLMDALHSNESSTSGLLNPDGTFEIWPKGVAADGADEWKGPVSGRRYYFSTDPSLTRRGEAFEATDSFR
ncbi:MAG: hypothetical protein VKO21_08250 [Candidatus Sericytochromatia bacterium]|nr:hypothetical protein [Candidatus Sericytochromatia bacterium]